VKSPAGEEIYTVKVDGKEFTVTVSDGGDITGIVPLGNQAAAPARAATAGAGDGKPVRAPLAGIICKVLVAPGQEVAAGEPVLMLEAMKMETAVSAPTAGVIDHINVSEGDSVAVGDILLTIA
jgi:oxaloacetate decarboxylase alpha subunit